MRCKWMVLGIVMLAVPVWISGCARYMDRLAYREYMGVLTPVDQEEEHPQKTITDDGEILFEQERLEIGLRPMTDEELNRQFPSATAQGRNPYTFGDTKWFRYDEVPQRFTVFRLTVKNYQYPKVFIDPTDVQLISDNGRVYHSLTREQLYVYFRTFATGGRSADGAGERFGNEYHDWQERMSILRRTRFAPEFIFSGQERDGFLVFEPLHGDVSNITVNVPEVQVRFDYRDVPIETLAVTARFHRDTGRLYPDGELKLTYEVR